MALDILRQRLHNQSLSQPKFTQPAQVVAWLGAVQSQDYPAAKWALAQRANDLTDTAIEESFARGEFLRTHILRPTWHFVTPTDIRWILTLTAPRVRAAMAYMNRQLGLEAAIFKKSNAVLTKALRGGNQLTRTELGQILQKAGLPVDGLNLGHLMIRAELDAVICSGARRGKQHTYALLEERAPQAKTLEHDEALAELTQRYFRSHGPATLADFVWWSGLTMKDVRQGVEAIKSKLESETIADQTYWFEPSAVPRKSSGSAYLLPNYDEYTVAYTDRTAIFDAEHTDKLDSRGNVLFQNAIMVHGRLIGTWKRTLKKKEVVIELALFTFPTEAENQAIIAAAQRFGVFLGLPVVLAHSVRA